MAAAQTTAAPDRSALLGVGLMLVVALIGAVDSVIVRRLSPAIHPFVMGFTRALFGLLAMLPWILGRPGMLRSHYRVRHALRAALKLASLFAYFAAFAVAPLADVTAIAFTAPSSSPSAPGCSSPNGRSRRASPPSPWALPACWR